MALLSDLDWGILLLAGGFLFLGKDSRGLLRTLGRYYGRAIRLKQELLAEFGKAAELPIGGLGPSTSIRSVILGGELPSAPSIPVAVAHPPSIALPATASWAGAGLGPETWSRALPERLGPSGGPP